MYAILWEIRRFKTLAFAKCDAFPVSKGNHL